MGDERWMIMKGCDWLKMNHIECPPLAPCVFLLWRHVSSCDFSALHVYRLAVGEEATKWDDTLSTQCHGHGRRLNLCPFLKSVTLTTKGKMLQVLSADQKVFSWWSHSPGTTCPPVHWISRSDNAQPKQAMTPRWGQAFSLRTPKNRQTAIYLPLSGTIQGSSQCSAKQHHDQKDTNVILNNTKRIRKGYNLVVRMKNIYDSWKEHMLLCAIQSIRIAIYICIGIFSIELGCQIEFDTFHRHSLPHACHENARPMIKQWKKFYHICHNQTAFYPCEAISVSSKLWQ